MHLKGGCLARLVLGWLIAKCLLNCDRMASRIERLKFAIICKWSNETMAFWQTKQQDGAKRPQCGATRGASVGLLCRAGGS